MYADSLKRILKRTDERRGCIVGWLTFWNPKNLQKKVDMYGYHFSWKTHAVMIFLALAGVIGIGAVFRLKAGGVVIALTAVIMMLPVLVLCTIRCTSRNDLRMLRNIWSRCYMHFRKQEKF